MVLITKRKKQVKPTFKQRKAVENIIANNGNLSLSMRQAGYSPNVAKTPTNLTERQGFKLLCDEYGLTEQLILTSLANDIQDKPRNRKGELELGAKIRGLLTSSEENVQRERVVVIPYELIRKNEEIKGTTIPIDNTPIESNTDLNKGQDTA